MNRVTKAALLGGVAVGLVAARRVLRQIPSARSLKEPADRWLVLTVNRRQEEIAPHNVWPQPLADLGDEIEIELRQAPGNRGTEIAVREREPHEGTQTLKRIAGRSQGQEIRAALRDTKQLLEAGEILAIDPQPHGPRKSTPGSAVIAVATDRARREGVL
jgi:hypothetical protein